MDESLMTQHEPVAPSLRFLFRLRSTLATPITIGSSTGQSTRKVIPLTAGLLYSQVGHLTGESAFDGAECLDSGGADYLVKDSETTSLTRLDARYVFRLRSGHHLYIQSSGRRYVPSGDSAATTQFNQGADIDPKQYYFRLKLIFESDDPNPAIQEACNKIVVASAVRGESSIVYDAYMLE